MTDWDQLFLGLIAAATVLMALVHVAAVIAAARVAGQARQALGTAQQTLASAQQTMSSVREEIRPLLAKAQAIADEASRTATLATAQVEKIDRLVTDVSRRVDETTAVIQQAIVVPARRGIAIMAAVKAGLAVLRAGDLRGRTSRSEEDHPLFIG